MAVPGLRRLYWRLWFAVFASLVVFALLAGLAWRLVDRAHPLGPDPRALGELAAAVLPPAGAAPDLTAAALEAWKGKLRNDFALFDADGAPLGATAADMPRPADLGAGDGERTRRPTLGPLGPAMALALPDGRTLVMRRTGHRPPPGPPFGEIGSLVLLTLVLGLGTYPVVRRLTRRLERLQSSVERLGQGDLSARVAVEGRDEVAQLAASFNHAVGRIERLVAANKALLANASHELRSPLARLRMAVEMLDAHATPALRAELSRDIAELDQLIDEILLSSRIDATNGPAALELAEVDLTGLAAEECARAGAALDGPALSLIGDARLLRRLLRNLLENAARHGGAGAAVTLSVAADGGLQIDVADRGPGVPAGERERIFEPFYRAAGARERSGGVGLGLALVRQIAQAHGGTAICLQPAGGGSVFRVRLAPMPPPAGQTQPPARARSAA